MIPGDRVRAGAERNRSEGFSNLHSTPGVRQTGRTEIPSTIRPNGEAHVVPGLGQRQGIRNVSPERRRNVFPPTQVNETTTRPHGDVHVAPRSGHRDRDRIRNVSPTRSGNGEAHVIPGTGQSERIRNVSPTLRRNVVQPTPVTITNAHGLPASVLVQNRDAHSYHPVYTSPEPSDTYIPNTPPQWTSRWSWKVGFPTSTALVITGIGITLLGIMVASVELFAVGIIFGAVGLLTAGISGYSFHQRRVTI